MLGIEQIFEKINTWLYNYTRISLFMICNTCFKKKREVGIV